MRGPESKMEKRQIKEKGGGGIYAESMRGAFRGTEDPRKPRRLPRVEVRRGKGPSQKHGSGPKTKKGG